MRDATSSETALGETELFVARTYLDGEHLRALSMAKNRVGLALEIERIGDPLLEALMRLAGPEGNCADLEALFGRLQDVSDAVDRMLRRAYEGTSKISP